MNSDRKMIGICLSQAHTFLKTDLISELDRARHPGRAYDAYVEDATVNYLYALYMLSRCEAFMYSCHCGGVSLARQFNEDRYQKQYSFADSGKE